MTSGTGTCTVHYNQAGNDNYNAAPEKTEDVTAEKADQTITFAAIATRPSATPTSTPVRPPAPASAPSATTGAGDDCSIVSGKVSHHRRGHLHRDRPQGGNPNYNAAPAVCELSSPRPTRRSRSTPRTGDEGLRHLLHGRRQRQLRPRGQLQRHGRLQQRRCHLHDDERHRHLHRPLQPGRQRQLQRRAREDRGRHRREGRPDDHVRGSSPKTFGIRPSP